MAVILDDALAEEALVAASLAGSKTLVLGLIKAGVKAGSTYGAALVVAEYNGHEEIADLLREQMRKENSKIPNWRAPTFSI